MDAGPFRASRPSRKEQAHENHNAADGALHTPAPSDGAGQQAVALPDTPLTKKALPKKWFVVGVAAIVVTIAVLWLTSSFRAGAPGIDASRYQAVFLTNGQVYFGKLRAAGDYLKLSDVYYLQTPTDDTSSDNPQSGTANQKNAQLTKLGSEIHGPEDSMVISKEQVLFYENLKTDSSLVKSIEQHKQSTK